VRSGRLDRADAQLRAVHLEAFDSIPSAGESSTSLQSSIFQSMVRLKIED
jgi:hypothetical protein